ncbi:MAG TPA: hypothetical protein G4O10_07580 [Dehalococcoidia bacterium]|nr:hypothetical protein [Dehalococcoidia bacterium]
MDKERNEEQEFLKDVDRFLNGEEVTPDEGTNEDTRSAIEFARKLTELRAEPSPEFQESLKSKLLRKLTEQEVAAREKVGANWLRDFMDRLMPQSPVWRTAVVTVAILMVATGVMWRTGMFTPTGGLEGETLNGRFSEETFDDESQKWNGMAVAGEQEEEEEGEAVVNIPPWPGAEDDASIFGEELQLEIEITAIEAITRLAGAGFTAPYGDEVTLTLVFTNTGSEPITIDMPQITIAGAPEIGIVYTLSAVDDPVELIPSEPLHMLFVWEQQDSTGAQVTPGVYIFNIGTITITRGDDTFEIVPPSVEVTVVEPQQ